MKRLAAAALLLALAMPARAQRAPLPSVSIGSGEWHVVLLHGYGAPADDLVPLARTLSARVAATFDVPGAPMPLPGGGEQWFPIHGDAVDADVRAACTAVQWLIEGSGVSPSHVIVGGFSQGAMMSIEMALGPLRLGGIAVLSGRALEHPPASYARLSGLPIFASHGRSDPRIPYDRGAAFVTRARENGADVTFVPFDGGHAIPPAVEDALAGWLSAHVR